MIMDMTSKDKTTITFTEVDELDNPTSTYIYSASSQEAPSSSNKKREIAGRVDIEVDIKYRFGRALLTTFSILLQLRYHGP